jgi:MAF protein
MTGSVPGIRRLILASGSPRRKELFALLGMAFVIKAANVDESPLDGELPAGLVLRVSEAKARAVRDLRQDELVVAADTVVALDDAVLGKPTDAADARRMLLALRGRRHMVYSGISVWHAGRQHLAQESVGTAVWMRDYAEQEVRRYVASGDPLDKAGAYAIQHPGFDPVAEVEGCWLNVMGLPLCHLGRMLAQFGVTVPSNVAGSCRAYNQRDCSVAPGVLRAR